MGQILLECLCTFIWKNITWDAKNAIVGISKRLTKKYARMKNVLSFTWGAAYANNKRE